MSASSPHAASPLGDMLERLGYKVGQSGNEKHLLVQSSGLEFTIVEYDDQSLGFFCYVGGAEEFTLEQLNEANGCVRFGKFAMHNDTLAVMSDFVFCEDEGDPAEQIRKIMRIWDSVLGELKQLVIETLQPA